MPANRHMSFSAEIRMHGASTSKVSRRWMARLHEGQVVDAEHEVVAPDGRGKSATGWPARARARVTSNPTIP